MSWNSTLPVHMDMFAGLMGEMGIKCDAHWKGRSQPPFYRQNEPLNHVSAKIVCLARARVDRQHLASPRVPASETLPLVGSKNPRTACLVSQLALTCCALCRTACFLRLARFLPHELEERHGRAQKGGWARHSPLTSPLISAFILCFFTRAFCLPRPLFIDAARDTLHAIARETWTTART